MKKLIILFIAIAAIASAESKTDIYLPDPWHQIIPGFHTVVDTIDPGNCKLIYDDIFIPPAKSKPWITHIKLTDDGKLEVYYRAERYPSMIYDGYSDLVKMKYEPDDVWKDVYEAQVTLSMVGCIIRADTIIVKAKTVRGKVVPEKTMPERIEWPEDQ